MSEVKLYNGDFLEKIRLIEDNSIDLVLTDPPFGTTQCPWDSIIPLNDHIEVKIKNKIKKMNQDEFFLHCFKEGKDIKEAKSIFKEKHKKGMWTELNRVVKKDGNILIFGTDPFSSQLINSNIKNFKYDWFWKKNKSTNFLNAKKQPLRNIERISVFNSGKYFPQKTSGHKPVNSFTKNTGDGDTLGKTKLGYKGGGSTERYPTQFLEFNVVNNDNSGEERIHPSQKPTELLEYLIKTFSKEKQTVLDFTFGSGSCAIAALQNNRSFIGIELDKDYFKKTIARIKKYNKNLKIYLN